MTPGRALVNSSEETISGKRVNMCQETRSEAPCNKIPTKKKGTAKEHLHKKFFPFQSQRIISITEKSISDSL